ncbi:hypothetical protein X943_003973 [Babesia divergens]|uniref:Uncharacterized protein n=1 Tax=Babesia divergens TaxID=32595 RepID=A0AAD9LJ99_BABDI|nr:hypothetical protein X943_003973 [Babesia divergens]
MDDLGYEWYTGFRTPQAVGETIQEALNVYMDEINAVINDDSARGHMSHAKSPIEFTGINVEISHQDQLDMLERTNKAIDKWLPLCAPHIGRSDCGTSASSKLDKHGDAHECDVSTIRLQTAHHVTLFYYAMHDATQQLDDPRVEQAYELMQELCPEFQMLRDTLTPYEFAIAMLYRYFYKIQLPFERRERNDAAGVTERTSQQVPVALKHLVFVPGVVMCATALLGRNVVSVPSPDGIFGPYDNYTRGSNATMEMLLNECQELNGVMVEENHCTHVTLGVTKSYKPVVSNNICKGIKDYLQHVAEHAGSKLSEHHLTIKKVTLNKKVYDMEPKELLQCLQIYTSGHTEFKHAKPSFVELLPYLVNGEDETALLEKAKCLGFERSPETIETKQQHCYKRTKCFVSEDMKWIYIRRLPIDRDMGHGKGDVKDDWVVDAYLCALDRTINGKIQFYA